MKIYLILNCTCPDFKELNSSEINEVKTNILKFDDGFYDPILERI